MTIIRIMVMLFIDQKDHCLGTLIILIDLLYQVSNHDFTMYFRFFESFIHFYPNILENDTYSYLQQNVEFILIALLVKHALTEFVKVTIFLIFN